MQSQSPTGMMQPLGSVVSSNHQYIESQQYPPVQPMVQQVPLPNQGYSVDLRSFVDFLSQHSDPRIGAQFAPLAVANAMSGGTWPWGPPPEQNPHANPPQLIISQGHYPDPSSLPNVYAPNIGHSVHVTDSQHQDVPPSPTLPPSIRRRSPVFSRSSSSQTSKGKRKSSAMSSGYLPSSAESSSAPHRNSVSRQPSNESGILFTSENGRRLLFFIQVDLKPRQSTITAVKVRILVMFIRI
jgi:hypothetical protein